MRLLIILIFLVHIPLNAIRFFSAFRTPYPIISSVFIGQVYFDTKTPCTVQPIVFTTLDTFGDSRQVIGAREDIAVVFPLPKVCDRFGRDINARGEFNMLAYESGFGVLATGPESNGYRVAGLIAADFLGTTDSSIGALRFLHGLGIVDFPGNRTLYFGQLWHLLVIPDCFPQTVSFSNGSPFESRTRCPQLRFDQRWGSFDFTVAFMSAGSFVSPGPIGLSYTYLSNSLTPDFGALVRKHFGLHQVGAAFDVKRLVPRLVSDQNIKVNEHVTSFIVEGWAALNFNRASARMKVIYAQNAADHIMLGGYAVRTIDPYTDARTYSVTSSINAWLDLSYVFASELSELGLFIAGAKNLGSKHRLAFVDGAPIIYPAAPIADIATAFRVAPRFVYIKHPLRLGLELEITGASYGKLDTYAVPRHPVGVVNARFLATVYLVF